MSDTVKGGAEIGEVPLFLLSFRHRDELSTAATRAGWKAVAARRAEDAEARFLDSGAMIAVVDARGVIEDGLAAVRALADAVEVNAAALLVIIGRNDLGALDDVIEAGATHYLAAPFAEAEFLQSLRLAERHAVRLAGGWNLVERRQKDRPTKAAPARVVEPQAGSKATRDPLTGLHDAASSRRWIGARLASGRAPFHILLVAITKFEIINTAFGRDTGDALLQSVARLLAPLVSDLGGRRALIGRTTGAEYIIGLPDDGDGSRAILLAERLVEIIERPLMAGMHLVTLSSRIAIIESSSEDEDAAQLLRRASSALAEAKAGDQGHIRLVSGAGRIEQGLDAHLQSDLRHALERNEIEILYQPQVSVTTGKIIGVEALARWMHPRHGELGAVTLFAVAEQSDYLLALSAHVQQRAVAKAVAWGSALSGLRLSVNITSADVARAGFAESFLAMVDASGFPRSRLTIEITESGLIEDLAAAASLLAALRAGGCRVAIDDFGTGYSSLAYLKALPLDYLKIDKKLAQDIAGSTRDRVVVRGVIDMARSLGLSVIAEGVETEEQLALLAREGCNIYQGFLCAEPLSTAALEALMAARG
jgi:diguanylate cyclase (GGDEF)-like protein